jgi:acetylornithine deacetylase
MSDRDRAMMILGDLVGFPTVTSLPNLDLINHVIAILEPLGYDLRVTRDGSGHKANLLASIGPGIEDGVVLSGHTDVVPAEEQEWTGAPFVAMRRDQKIYGRGAVDMKGFIACALALAPEFAEIPLKRPIHIALTFDEEVGCRGAPILIADMLAAGIRPGAVVVGEPTEMGIVVAHKGMHEYTTTLVGLEGHGSLPGQAVNAVQFGTRFVTRLVELGAEMEDRAAEDSPFRPPQTTISVGSMHGGVAHNIVAGDCVIQWEMRPVSESDTTYVLDRVEEFEKQLLEEMHLVSPTASIDTVTEGAVGGLEQLEHSPAFDLVSTTLGDTERRVAAFSTEAGLYQAAGIPAVVCGPGSIEVAHQPDEYISLDQLERCLTMMKGLAHKLST